jgi:hypothetical protein
LSSDLPTADYRKLAPGILEAYHRRLVENGIYDYDLEDCWRDYALGLTVRLVRLVLVDAAWRKVGAGELGFMERAIRRCSVALEGVDPGSSPG